MFSTGEKNGSRTFRRSDNDERKMNEIIVEISSGGNKQIELIILRKAILSWEKVEHDVITYIRLVFRNETDLENYREGSKKAKGNFVLDFVGNGNVGFGNNLKF